jgi:hypothetical protein
MSHQIVFLAAGGVVGLALLALTASRPPLGAAILAFVVPMTAALGSGAFLHPDQGAVAMVALGWLVHEIPRRRPQPFIGLDLAVAAFAVGGIIIPWAVLMLGHQSLDLSTMKNVLQPGQYFLVYLIFSRTDQREPDMRLALNLTMAASVIVSVVAIGELLVPSVQNVVETYYDHPTFHPWDSGYRPSSTLGHYSGVAGFGLMNTTLALALLVTRDRDFKWWWLVAVMAANIAGMMATTTLAPLLSLPVAAAVVLWYAGWRPSPRQVMGALVVVGAAFLAFLPYLEGRLNEQLSGRGTLLIPETMATRIQLWQEFFLPTYVQNGLWFGTGTLVPPDVPRSLVDNVDNEFLFAAYRGGVVGLGLLVLLLLAIAVAALGLRRRRQPLARAIGATATAFAVTIALVGVTSEYITFGGVSQELWMVVGMVALLTLSRPLRESASTVIAQPSASMRVPQQVGTYR